MPRTAAKSVKPTEVTEHNSENLHPNFQRETRSRKRKQPTSQPVAAASSAPIDRGAPNITFTEKPVAEWTVEDVGRWCCSVEVISDLAHRLEKWQISGSVLLSISTKNVNAVCRLRGQQGKLLVQAIDELRHSNKQVEVQVEVKVDEEAGDCATNNVPKRACVREKTVPIVNVKHTKASRGTTIADDPSFVVHDESVLKDQGTQLASSSRDHTTAGTESKEEPQHTTAAVPAPPVVAASYLAGCDLGSAPLAASRACLAPPTAPIGLSLAAHEPTQSQEVSTQEASCGDSGSPLAQKQQNLRLALEDPDVEYDEELHAWMLGREGLTRPNTQYMKWHPCLNEKMRSILLDWIMEVCREFEMQRETFHLTVNLVDRFLSCVSEVHKNRLQLVGVAALFVASKVEEVYPPKANEFALITDGAFTIQEIYKMERLVLRKMEWDVISVTPCWWTTLLVHRVHAAHLTDRFAGCTIAQKSKEDKYCLAMGLLDIAVLGYQSMQFTPSALAAATVYHMLELDQFLLEQVTGLEMSDMMPCIKWMEAFAVCLRADQSHWCTKHNLTRNLTDDRDVHTIQPHDPDALNKLKEHNWMMAAPAAQPSVSAFVL